MLSFDTVEEKKEIIKTLIKKRKITFGESDKSDIYQTIAPCGAPVTYAFGELTQEQKDYLANENPAPHCTRGRRSPMRISSYWGNNAEILGSEISNLIKAWNDINREGLLKGGLSVKNARIDFGYKDKVYSLRASALGMDDGIMEKYAPAIMESMRICGVNYAEYLGYLD